VKIRLTRNREELCERINRRVEQMMAGGLPEEARRVYPFRHLNSPDTIGYKELFAYLDSALTLDFAVEKIKRNSCVYARKQMTRLKAGKEITWFSPEPGTDIPEHIRNSCG
jgi:tRNA dimethylallyltransferase